MTTTEMQLRLTAVEREVAQFRAQLGPQRPDNKDGAEGIGDDFESLLREWQRDTLIQSDPVAILTHPAYYRIIGMGPAVLPRIFKDLKAGGGFWFVALEAITGVNPVAPEHCRSIRQMQQDWLDWGRAKGIIND